MTDKCGCGWSVTWRADPDGAGNDQGAPARAADGHAAGPRCPRPGRRARRLASAPSSCAARNLDTGEIDQVLVPLRAHPRPRSARRARSGPRRCGRRSAGKALAPRGRTRRPGRPGHRGPEVVAHSAAPRLSRVRDMIAATGDDTADFDQPIAGTRRPDHQRGVHPRESVPRPKPARRHRSTRRRQDARICPAAKSAPARSARPTRRRTARPSARRCS